MSTTSDTTSVSNSGWKPGKWLALVVVSLFLFATPGWGAKPKPYKIYVINKYGAWDIVCDSYTVKKNDHIWEILRRKGSIAEDDFPEFVRILKELNPGIRDVNKIYPEQKLLIPLKQIQARDSHAELGPRYITIPMIPDVLFGRHTVSSGECLSKIVATRLQVRWDQIPEDYLQTFQRLNPRIKNLDLIYSGQTIRIPELSSEEAPVAEPAPVVVAKEDLPLQETIQGEMKEETEPLKPLVVAANEMPAQEEEAEEEIAKPDAEPKVETEEPAAYESASEPDLADLKEVLPDKEPVAQESETELESKSEGASSEDLLVASTANDEVETGAEPAEPEVPMPSEAPPEEEIAKPEAEPELETEELAAYESEPEDSKEVRADEAPGKAIETSTEQPRSSPTPSGPSGPSISGPSISAPSGDQTGATREPPTGSKRVVSRDNLNIISSGRTTGLPSWQNVVSRVATQVGGKLLASGHCYFPGKDRQDVALDLAAFPVIELKNGQHVLFEKEARLPWEAEEVIRSSWKGLLIIYADTKDTHAAVLDKVFSAVYGESVRKDLVLPMLDDGVQVTLRGNWILPQETRKGTRPAYYCISLIDNPGEFTSAPVAEYLAKDSIHIVDVLTEGTGKNPTESSWEKDSERAQVFTLDGSGQQAFVSGFVQAMGFLYEKQVPISFDYAGFQVETTANIIYGGDSTDVVVDFGTFYGDTKSAVEAGGLGVLSIQPDDKLLTIAKNVLNVLGSAYTEEPVLLAANRKVSKTTSLTIPGFLISYEKNRDLLARGELDPNLIDFLTEQRIRVLKVRETLGTNN